jgi:hypothetical protein
MRSEVVGQSSVVSDDLRNVDQELCERRVSQFHNFSVNFRKFRSLFSMRLSQFGSVLTHFKQDVFQKFSRVGAKCREKLRLLHTFLERFHKNGDEFLNHIVRVTGDETWVSFVSAETKEQSKQWMHTHLPDEPKSLNKSCVLGRKLIYGKCLLGEERNGDGVIHATRGQKNIRSLLRNTKKLLRVIQFRAKGTVC